MKKSKTKIAEISFTGDEPELSGEITRIQLSKAFNWYNYFYTIKETKKWILEYMRLAEYPEEDIQLYKSSNSSKITQTYASIARLLTRGAIFDNNLEQHINEIVEAEKTCKSTTTKTCKTTHKDEINELIADIDVVLDQFYLSEFKEIQDITETVKNRKSTEYKDAIDYYQSLYDFVIREKDYYKETISIRKYNKYIKQLELILESLNVNKIVRKRVVRKPRKKKVRSPQKLVSGLKYLSVSPEYNISSFEPVKIIGSSLIYLFDVKYRKLTKLVAGENGFYIKGTTIYGYDEKKSYFIRLRKPDEFLPKLITEGKRTIDQSIKALTTKPSNKVTGRTGNTTVLLRYFK